MVDLPVAMMSATRMMLSMVCDWISRPQLQQWQTPMPANSSRK